MDHPFQRWIDLARPRAQLWRTAVGGVLVIGVWLVWTNVVGLIAIRGGLVSGDALRSVMGSPSAPLTYLEMVTATGVIFGTFWGLWFGVWAVARFLHKRQFASVLGHDRRFHAREFGVGLVLAAIYLVVGVAASFVMGQAPQRSTLPVETWLAAFIPLALLTALQSAGEELFFRGYLVQQLAARVRLPLVWGLLPAMAFGFAHASNAGGDAQFAVYYVFAATMLGLVMTAMVWRTGGLSAAMGFHVMNNIGALLVINVAGVMPPISLFVMTYDDAYRSAPVDLLSFGLMLAFVLSPFAPLPKGQPLRRNETRAAP